MHKCLKFDVRHGFVYRTDLVDREFAGKHSAFETQVPEMSHMVRCAVVALRGSVQTNRRQVEIQEMQILDDQRIDTYLI